MYCRFGVQNGVETGRVPGWCFHLSDKRPVMFFEEEEVDLLEEEVWSCHILKSHKGLAVLKLLAVVSELAVKT